MLTYVSGEILPRPDTVRFCLRGLQADNLVLSEPLTRAGRRVVHSVCTPPRVYTLDASPSGVIIQLNGTELRPASEPEEYFATALGELKRYWRDITMPRIDWAVQLDPTRYELDDVVRLALAAGFREALPSENRLRYVVGSDGVSRYLYWRRARQRQDGQSRACGVDRVELLIYTAVCPGGFGWLRVECREYISSREPGYYCHPLTQSLLLELGRGIVIPESDAVIAVAVDRKRATRRALSMLLADVDLPIELLARLAEEIYGPLLDVGLLSRFDRLRRYCLDASKNVDDLDLSDVGVVCAHGGHEETKQVKELFDGVQNEGFGTLCR